MHVFVWMKATACIAIVDVSHALSVAAECHYTVPISALCCATLLPLKLMCTGSNIYYDIVVRK